jgi:hypothetical protein
MSARWFAQHRLAWIAEMLEIYGFINRDHLQRKFGISEPQASKDFATYQRTSGSGPAMVYNVQTKRYEAAR